MLSRILEQTNVEIFSFIGLRTGHDLGVTSTTIYSNYDKIANFLLTQFPKQLYICGGRDNSGSELCSLERLDLATGLWQTLPTMSVPRVSAAAAPLAGKLYVCGGSNTFDVALSLVERFDPVGCLWEQMPEMLLPRRACVAVSLADTLLVCGGCFREPLKSMERLNLNLMKWEMDVHMTTKRWAPAAAVVSGQIYMCGGMDGDGSILSSCERFNPKVGAWVQLPSMSSCRFAAAATSHKGIVYVCGGQSMQSMINSAECLDTTRESSAWTVLEMMSCGRRAPGVVALNGRIFVFGGRTVSGGSSSVECYDPAVGGWEKKVPPMKCVRIHPASAALRIL